MQYVNLGNTGLQISRIGLGMLSYGTPNYHPWVLTEEQGRPIVQKAVEAGINFFDTADMYSRGLSEQVTGNYLREFLPRDEYIVTTKVRWPHGDKPNQGGLSRKHIMDAIDESLKNLGLDYVDLYQIHGPDDNTPIAETMEALHDVVKMGKARYIGAGNSYAWQFAKAQYTADLHGWTRFVSMQSQYNLVYREHEREVIPFCIDQNVGFLPWSPIARGFLAGNRAADRADCETLRGRTDDRDRRLYFTDADYAVLEAVKTVAQKRGHSPAQIALAWVLHKPGVTSPIIGASKMYQLDEAIAALDIRLDDEEIAALEAPYRTKII